ncbi:MFS transporter [Malacoplasma penetrans]|nr:MFS transporter [Malacoplasma penetrans]
MKGKKSMDIKGEKQIHPSVTQTTIGATKQTQVQKSDSSSVSISQKRLVLMWSLILLGYFLFVVQWYSISNFAGGYTQNIGSVHNNPALAAMPNWTITLMRGIGSILAGWLLAKVGHRYAVITVLSLMVAAFPFIIFASVPGNELFPGAEYNSDGVYAGSFAFFLIFRLFLAIGGTTLITYTNSVIAKMPTKDRPKFMTINQFGFNGGAFFANIFFCFGISQVINGTDAWIYILSTFVVLIAVILVLYFLWGKEVIPRATKGQNQTTLSSDVSYGKVFKSSYTWKLATIFIIWLVSVVFINSSTMRNVIEQSPANLKALVEWNIANGKTATSMANSTLSTSSSVVVGGGYDWVWPAFICCFVAGFFVGLVFISPYSKTIFKRKKFFHTMFALGFVLAAISIMCGYFGGYGNGAALAFMLIFIFFSGTFLWAVQPVLLSVYQQAPWSSPKYAGIVSGLIWGIGYVGYTIVELLLSVIFSYAGTNSFAADVTNLTTQITSNNGTYLTNGVVNWTAIDEAGIAYKTLASDYAGSIVVLVFFFVVCGLVFIPIQLLKSADMGTKDANGNFVPFSKEWNFLNWKFKDPAVMIK